MAQERLGFSKMNRPTSPFNLERNPQKFSVFHGRGQLHALFVIGLPSRATLAIPMSVVYLRKIRMRWPHTVKKPTRIGNTQPNRRCCEVLLLSGSDDCL